MQTKKKISARHSREHASPRVCRPQKKVLETVQVAETKVKASELITSSARKQKTALDMSFKVPGLEVSNSQHPTNNQQCNEGGFSPKHAVVSKNVNNKHILTIDEHDTCLGSDTVNGAIFDHKVCNEGSDERSAGTIFSPSFHISKDAGDNIENAVDFIKFFRKEDEKICNDGGNQKSQDPDAVPTRCSSEMDIDSAVSFDSDMSKYGDQGSDLTVDRFGANLSSEVSAIYLAMQQSKLECVDEQSPTCMSTDVPVEDDDCEDLDYFDPFLFIKNLPVLAEVVPTFRPSLLPKQTRRCPRTSLVLDLDETLVHSSLEPCEDADFTFPVTFNLMQHTVYVRCRPHLMDFMERVASLFEIIIFTASQSIYAEQLLNVLDPKRKIFRHRIYRDSCVFVEGNYLKDLSILGRDLAHVIIVDNSPQAFGFQVENGIPIESWFDDRSDKELLLLLPFLETLNKAEDVRPLIAEKFNLREKVAAAVYPSLNSFGR